MRPNKLIEELGKEKNEKLLRTLENIVNSPLKLNKYKNVSWKEFIGYINKILPNEIFMEKTLTSCPYVLLIKKEYILLNFLFYMIGNFNDEGLEMPNDILFYQTYFPFACHVNQALFVGTTKKINELSPEEIKMYSSNSRSNIENMLFEYSIMVLYLDRDNEVSTFRDKFLNIVYYCHHSELSKKYCLREAIKLLMLSYCPKWFLPGYIDMRKQKVNFNYCDILGRIQIDGIEILPRIKFFGYGYKFDNGEIDKSQPDAIRLMEIMANSAKTLLAAQPMESINKIIDFVLTTDLLPLGEYITKDKYIITKINQNTYKLDDKTKRLIKIGKIINYN